MDTVNALADAFNPLRSLIDRENELYAAEILRRQVSEIIGSYHHHFDHLYECIQNAVDACERAFRYYQDNPESTPYIPMIQVTIDLQLNALTVLDNGLGMSKDDVTGYFFTPHASLKNIGGSGFQIRQRGEKGVGATFLSYGSNSTSLCTKSQLTGEMTSGKLEGALQWCNQSVDLLPMPMVEPVAPTADMTEAPHGTSISIQFSGDTNITNLSDDGINCQQWEAILRLNTALGYVDFKGDDPFFKALVANLIVAGLDGVRESKRVETGYYYPHITTQANVRLGTLTRDNRGRLPARQRNMHILWDVFTFEQVSSYVSARLANLNAREFNNRKRAQISEILNRYEPEAYIGFTYGAEFWGEANRAVWGEEHLGEFRHGIVFATKSQKIGEQKRIEFRYRTGDFNRFFILLSMNNLRADIGRKSLPEGIQEFANFFATSIQKVFSTDNEDVLKPTPGLFSEGDEVRLQEVQRGVETRESLTLDGLHLVKVPNEEQDVVALFFDLLGSGRVRGYEIYSTSLQQTYDGLGRFRLADAPENRYDHATNRLGIYGSNFSRGIVESRDWCFVEFKYNSDGLVGDVRSGYKRLRDLKWLICWDIGSRHENEGIELLDITVPEQANWRDYYGVTHLMIEGQDKVHVICLKTVLDVLASSD